MNFVKNKYLNLIGSILCILCIFFMFGKIMGGELAAYAINMFEGAFGKNATHEIQASLLVVFILHIINIGISTFIIIYILKKKNLKPTNILIIIQSIIALINLILSFATLPIMGIENVPMGVGPVLFSVFNILVIMIHIIGLILSHNKLIVTSNPNVNDITSVKSPRKDESENIDLLIKYKDLYDKKIITKEEFEKKKEDLLNK